MARIHLFEVHEKAWCPALVRNLVTEYLHFVTDAADAYAPIADDVAALLPKAAAPRLVDLCAGGGGAIVKLQGHLEEATGAPVPVLLTDLFPNREAFRAAAAESGGGVTHVAEPVDARAVPEDLTGVRTIFNAFHHFRPAEARGILEDAVHRRAPIAIVEASDRGVLPAIPILLIAPLFVVLTAPFVRPFRWSRLLLSWLVPLMPLVIAWDGAVSTMRVYSPAELDRLTAGLDAFEWRHGRTKQKGLVIQTLLGWPREQPAAAA